MVANGLNVRESVRPRQTDCTFLCVAAEPREEVFYETFSWHAKSSIGAIVCCYSGCVVGRGGAFHHDRSPALAGVCAAAVSGGWIPLDSRILGLGTRRLLLGPGRLGGPAPGWFFVDSGLLGICEELTSGMQATGVRMWDSTAELITGSDIRATDFMAAFGPGVLFATTPRWSM
jgi:hypothetical protein